MQQLARLLNQHRTAPEQTQAALDAAMAGALHLTKAMYILTPHIVYQLKDMNLLTGQPAPPPPSEHRAAAGWCRVKNGVGMHSAQCPDQASHLWAFQLQ